jgi:DNA-binding FadR family transcriptional regulator
MTTSESSDENLCDVQTKRTSTVDKVIERIKDLLIQRRLNPGDPLPNEATLSESMGVSRGSLREAMKVLSAFGIVEVRRGDGTYVATSANPRIFDPLVFSLLIHKTDPEELIQLRQMIELDVIRLIIRNATADQIAELRQVHVSLRETMQTPSSDDDELDNLDIRFHRVMARIAGNRLIESIYNFIIDLYEPTINARMGASTHDLIMRAIEQRDPTLAETSEQQHIAAWRRSYRTL